MGISRATSKKPSRDFVLNKSQTAPPTASEDVKTEYEIAKAVFISVIEALNNGGIPCPDDTTAIFLIFTPQKVMLADNTLPSHSLPVSFTDFFRSANGDLKPFTYGYNTVGFFVAGFGPQPYDCMNAAFKLFNRATLGVHSAILKFG